MIDKTLVSMTARVLSLAYALGVFSVLYSLTNFYADSLFHDIGLHGFSTTHSLWAKQIYQLDIATDSMVPFIPTMIVPYSWSFIVFCASFFIVKTPKQLSLLTRRLILATLFGCLIFYLFPARFTFERPEVAGWTRFGYEFLSLTDKPYNQLPSLHVAYAILLGTSLWRTSKSILWHMGVLCVCSLIIISTIFTYQHHLLDVAGGLVLAVVVIVIANKLQSNLVLKYLTIAIAGFLIFSVVGYKVGYTFMINHNSIAIELLGYLVSLYWLISFLAVAWAYQYPNQSRDKRWFKKNSQGRLQRRTWLAFAPLLSGYYMMWYIGQRCEQCRRQDHELNYLDIATYHNTSSKFDRSSYSSLATAKLFEFSNQNINAHSAFLNVPKIIVIDCALEANSHVESLKKAVGTETQIEYLYFPLLDLQSFLVIEPQNFIELFKSIDSSLESNHWTLQAHNSQIVINFHCIMGFSRSVALHVLFLIYRGHLSADNYMAWIGEHYPRAHIDAHYLPESVAKNITLSRRS